MPTRNARMLLMSSAMAAAFALSALTANAQESVAAPGNLDLSEAAPANRPHFNLDLHEDTGVRVSELSAYAPNAGEARPRRFELEVAAPQNLTGMPLDVSLAQRAGFGASEAGDIDRRSRGAEVRVGALGDPRSDMSEQRSRFYVFAASDNEALTWRPGQQGRGIAMQQDRVEIGDRQAGVTYESGRLQASLAYVEREISATIGQTTTSNDENFAGFTLTMRQ